MTDLTVVKCGGTAAVDPGAVCADVARLHHGGHRTVLVHGGSADISRLARRLGVSERRLTAPDGVTTRWTDDAMLEWSPSRSPEWSSPGWSVRWRPPASRPSV